MNKNNQNTLRNVFRNTPKYTLIDRNTVRGVPKSENYAEIL